MKERLGLGFFTFGAMVSTLAAVEYSSLLTWLAVLHNAVLAVIYARRRPAQSYDRLGLWLGMLAALLPVTALPVQDPPLPALMAGLIGYALILWSLLSLGASFGIAPADRGLVRSGPYRWLRHPMYLGELLLRASLVISVPFSWWNAGLLLLLAAIQITRAQREERQIGGYPAYANQVRYRLLPGVW